MEIKIAWMYPDTLYLHGERGNILALRRFADELGLDTTVDRIDLGKENFDPMEYDILFYGPGEISSFHDVMNHVYTYERTLAEFVASGKVLIATGTTAAMFCEKITRFSPESKDGKGEVIEGLCMIPAESIEREYVFGDDMWINAEYNGKSMELIGNQIQMTDLWFSESKGYRRFGSVIYGRGNNGDDGTEGVVHNNSIFTNMLGPLFVNNPWLTTEVIKAALAARNETVEADDPSYDMEIKSFALKKDFIAAKGIRNGKREQ